MKEILGRVAQVFGLAIAVATSACGNPNEGASSTGIETEEAEVAAYLRATGTFEFEFDHAEGFVVLEGDILVPFSELLEQSRAFDPEELVEKGRWYLFPARGIYSGRVNAWPVQLQFDSNVPTAWRNAFTAAAAAWNVNECIAYGSSTLSKTTIHYKDLGSDPEKRKKYAQAPFPTKSLGAVRAGSFVDVNTTYGCPANCGLINTISAGLKMQVALHELGHTLGFHHTGEGHLITGTSSTAESFMVATFGEPGIAGFTADDKASRDRAYKKNGSPLNPSCSGDTFQ